MIAIGNKLSAKSEVPDCAYNCAGWYLVLEEAFYLCPSFTMASTLRKLKSLVLSQTTDIEQVGNLLETASIPLHTGDCRNCSDPCTQGNHVILHSSPSVTI
jgi:hypothetical protein